MRKIILLLILFFSFQNIYAQSFTVVRTDTTTFPTLKVSIQMNIDKEVFETDFKILDGDKKNLPFTLSSQMDTTGITGGRSIFFLVEATGFTAGRPVENFKKALLRVLDELNPTDKVNIGFFTGKSQDGVSLNTLSTDFSPNVGLFKDVLERKIEAPADSVPKSDAFKSIYETLEFFGNQENSGQKILIILSSSIDNSNSPFKTDDVIEKAVRMSIPIYSITYKTNEDFNVDNFTLISDKTNGVSKTCRTAFDIRTEINNFLSNTGNTNTKSDVTKNYMLTFITEQPADGGLHQFEIQYKTESQAVVYNTPARKKTSSFFANYGILIFIILGILAAYAIWYYIQYRKKLLEGEEEVEEDDFGGPNETDEQIDELREQNERLNDKVKNLEEEVQRAMSAAIEAKNAQPSQSQKYDLKKTIITSGGGTPVLMVATGMFNQNFPLNKVTMTIGRTANNDIMIPEQTVSGSHATISIENGSFFLTDLGSTNGTFVNGSRVNKIMLKSGDMVKLGAANCKFQI